MKVMIGADDWGGVRECAALFLWGAVAVERVKRRLVKGERGVGLLLREIIIIVIMIK